VGAVNPAEPALQRHGGERRGDVEAGFPLPGVGINAPAKLEDIGMGGVSGGDLFQFIVGLGVIAQANPALGGLQVDAVGWSEGLRRPCIRLRTLP